LRLATAPDVRLGLRHGGRGASQCTRKGKLSRAD
jgi:hypothetical protein